MNGSGVRDWVYRHFGTRRALLCIFALAWTGYGLGLIISPAEDRFSRPIGPSPLDPLDSRWWGLLWVACGVVVLALALRNRDRESIEFAAVIMPPMLWALFYAWSMLVWLGTAGEFGEHDAWVGLLHWMMLTLIIWLVAGWPDQIDRTGPSGTVTGSDVVPPPG